MEKGFVLEIMVKKAIIWVWGSLVWSRVDSWLLIWVISDGLLISILWWVFVDQEQADEIEKYNDQILKSF